MDIDVGIADPNGPGAIIGLVVDGELRRIVARGLANLENRAPIDHDTVFHVASVSKQFTAYAVALLAQEGRLSLDDPVATHLDWFPFQDISIRHLIHHVSGLRDHMTLTVFSGRRLEDVISSRDIRLLVARQRSLNFPPGSQYSYCNTGYALLAWIVEAVTGRCLAEFCAERIFDPLGMTKTAFIDDHHKVVPNRADSYYRRPDGTYGRLVMPYSNAGSTGLNTTVDDLARWARHTMTSPAREMLEQTISLPDGTELKYGAGVIIDNHHGFSALFHSGGDAGYRACLLVLPKRKAAAITLSNFADVQPVELARGAIKTLFPASPEEEKRKKRPATPPEVNNLAGWYLDSDGDTIYGVATVGGQLHLRFDISNLTLRPDAGGGRLVNDRLGFEVAPVTDGIVVHPDHGAPRYCRRLHPPVTVALNTGYAGVFYSAELDVAVRLETADDGSVALLHAGWGTINLDPLETDLFLATVPVSPGFNNDLMITVRFSADRSELRMSTLQARRVRFSQVDRPAAVVPASPPGPRRAGPA